MNEPVHGRTVRFRELMLRQQSILTTKQTHWADSTACFLLQNTKPTEHARTKMGKWYICHQDCVGASESKEMTEMQGALTVIANKEQLERMRQRGNRKAFFRAKPQLLFERMDNNVFLPRFYGLTHLGLPRYSVPCWQFDAQKEGPSAPIGRYQMACGAMYPEQMEAVDAYLSNLERDKYGGGGVIAAATGAGKTYMLCQIIVQLGVKSIVVVPSALMVHQMVADLQEYCPQLRVRAPHKLPHKRNWRDPDVDVWVMTTRMASNCNSVVKKKKNKKKNKKNKKQKDDDVQEEENEEEQDDEQDANMPSAEEFWEMGFRLLAMDEVHHVAAPSLRSAVHRLSMKYMLGLSATPDRSDGLEDVIYMFMGPVVYHWFPPRPLIRAEVWMLSTGIDIPLSFNKNDEVDMDAFFTAEASDETRSAIVSALTQRALHHSIGTMVAARRIEQLQNILEQLRETWYAERDGYVWQSTQKDCLYTITHSTDSAFRPRTVLLLTQHTPDDINRTLRNSEVAYDVVLTTLFKGEGLSYAFVKMVIIASTIKRPTQLIGRAVRPGRGKQCGAVIDLVDASPMCQRHAHERRKDYRAANLTVRDFLCVGADAQNIDRVPWRFFDENYDENAHKPNMKTLLALWRK